MPTYPETSLNEHTTIQPEGLTFNNSPRPELTPASFSVSAKHPSCPRRCMSSSSDRCPGFPMAVTVPANRLNCSALNASLRNASVCTDGIIEQDDQRIKDGRYYWIMLISKSVICVHWLHLDCESDPKPRAQLCCELGEDLVGGKEPLCIGRWEGGERGMKPEPTLGR